MNRIYLLLLLVVMASACNNGDQTSDAYGNFEADETIISSEVAGKLIRFDGEEGRQVKVGDVLAIIDSSTVNLQIQQLQAQMKAVAVKKVNLRGQIDVSQQQLQNAKITKDRVHKLFADKAATQQQVDDVDGQVRVLEQQVLSQQTQFASIDSELAVLQAQIASAENQLEKSVITSPVNGTILEKYTELGELAAPSKALVKLADLSELDLRVYVSGAQLPHVKLGQQVEVLIDEDKKTNQHLIGVVNWISSEAEFTPKIIQTKEERVKMVYAVKVKVKNDGRLKIGMPGEVNFQ
ncbi:HlyD family secretion protein [Mangrovibacterium diazotrophicum]|uniref:HlyD family secretion protein n=1 Tax=Mangrovibacterium diazotrophicum TaxID=1261403 RepID=A0A419W6R1_9BACT|nr:efflux RND transporter periplasmic adaptor subunit [Mangrovibacterium diazotrophicum]RKD91062.1 HlyD family secretion protein [Mangrovibacterium diazotrophicum]